MEPAFVATAFATALTIVDPIGMIPLTLAATSGVSDRKRTAIVDRAIVVAASIMLFMALVGGAILGYLGITFPAFTIAGGILLFLISIDMLFARPSRVRATDEETGDAAATDNPAVFPLAVPMLAGPGTIATVLLLVNLSRHDPARLGIVFVAFATALVASWACMRASTLLLRAIGSTGIHVVTRLLGIILAALAVQFVLNGLVESPLLHRG